MIYLDVDGVLNQFNEHAAKWHGREPSKSWNIAEEWGISASAFWKPLDVESFWTSLPKSPWADDLVELISTRGEFLFVTSPSLHPACFSGKAKWIKEHWPQHYRRLCICAKKDLLAHPGVTLLDDSVDNVEKFRRAGGQGIIVPASYNQDLNHITDVVSYVKGLL